MINNWEVCAFIIHSVSFYIDIQVFLKNSLMLAIYVMKNVGEIPDENMVTLDCRFR